MKKSLTVLLLVVAAVSASAAPLRVMSWNIQDGMWDGQGDDYARFVAYVKEKAPDVCIWTEAESLLKTGKCEALPAEERFLPKGWPALAARYGHRYVYLAEHRDDYPQVITSRFPIDNVKRIGGRKDNPVCHGAGWATITVAGHKINLVTFHAWPLGWKFDCWKPEERRKESIAAHGGDFQRRDEIEQVCAETILGRSAETGDLWLMAGDFNAGARTDNAWYRLPEDDPSFMLHDWIAAHTPYVDIVKRMHPDAFRPSVFNDRPGYGYKGGRRIDFVYLTPELARYAVAADVIRDDYACSVRDAAGLGANLRHPSDHLPVIVDFNLPDRDAADPAKAWKVRAVQLDLARQMETVDFIKRYLAFAKESGYNTVQLYLEGRVRTKSFPFRPEAETYSPAEMKEIVAEAGRLGLDLVPVVSVLGHAENFVNCRELDDVCEESRAGGCGRFGKGVLKQTFCHSVPRTREFLARYLVEMMEIFPGKNFHVGLDESFNTGFCPDCSAKMKTIGLGGIYMDVILWAHDVLAAHGRRMWMWDDFFEFFPEKVGQLPKDVLLCDWEYSSDISRNRGHYGCFGDRYRKDWMRLFRAKGLDALACPSQSKRPMTRYCDWSESCGQPGGIFVQWEMSTYFHAKLMTLARATGYRWSRGLAALSYDEALDESIRSLYPSLDAAGRQAVRALVEGASGGAAELALRTLGWADGMPQAVPADPFGEAGLIDDLAVVARQGLAARALADAEYEMTGLYRTPEKIRAAKRRVRAILPECERLRERRLAQERTWRPKCAPGGLAAAAKGLIAKAGKLLGTEESAAAADEWQLELSLVLPDFHGIPMWTVEGRFGGKWEKLGEGRWKPDAGEWCYFERTLIFRNDTTPDALRISYKGYNDAGLAYAVVANTGARFVPAKVISQSGRVRDAENVLEDTVDAAFFGNPNCRSAMLDPALADEVSSMEISLKPEFEDADVRVSRKN